MPSVLYFCEYGTIYGGENSMLGGFQYLKSRGYEICVACPTPSLLSRRVKRHGVPWAAFEWQDESGRRKPLERLRDEMAALIDHLQVDIVHANSLSVSRILGPIPRSGGRRYVGHLRDILKLSRKAVADISLLDRIFCVSQATRDYHLQQGLDPARSVVLHNGVDLTRFSPGVRSGTGTRSLRLVYIGQLILRKGVDVLLEATRAAITAGLDVRLDIYGECHSQKEEARQYVLGLGDFIQRHQLSSRVRFCGRTDSPADVLRQADVLVHPARQEPWGRVLLEAAATGLPIIATDVGGTAEMFPAEEALLVPPDDAAAFFQQLEKLYQSKSLRRKLGEAARQRIQQFDLAGYAGRLADHYQNLLQQPP